MSRHATASATDGKRPASARPPAPGRTARTPAGAPDGHDTGREQRIRELAYRHYVERGCVDGHDLEDWLRAEAQVD